MSIARQLLKGSALSVIEQGVRAMAALVMTPILVHCLGVAQFGVWALLTGFVSQFGALDMGLQSSLPKFLVQGDVDERRGIASTAQRLYFIIAAVTLVLMALAWLLLPFFISDAAKLHEARWVLTMLGVANAVVVMTRVLAVQVQCLMRQDLIAIISMSRVILCSAVLAWWLTQREGGLLAVGAVQAAGTAMEAMALAWCGRSLLPMIARRWAATAVAKRLMGFTGWSYLYVTSERLRSGLDGFVLGWLRGSAAAGVYGLGLRPVTQAFDTVYAAIGTQLLPTFGKIHEVHGHERLKDLFIVVSQLAVRVSVLAAVLVLALGPAFLRWWVPEHATEALPVLLCLALPFAMQTAQVPAVHLLFSLAKHRALAMAQALAVIVNLVLSWWLTTKMGIVGAALGTAVESIAMAALVMPWLMRRDAEVSVKRFIIDGTLLPALTCGLGAVPIGYVVWRWLEGHASLLAFSGAALVLSAWCAGWLIVCGARRDWARLRELVAMG
jgi:O-antigen/teichoic acid export membrane protein